MVRRAVARRRIVASRASLSSIHTNINQYAYSAGRCHPRCSFQRDASRGRPKRRARHVLQPDGAASGAGGPISSGGWGWRRGRSHCGDRHTRATDGDVLQDQRRKPLLKVRMRQATGKQAVGWLGPGWLSGKLFARDAGAIISAFDPTNEHEHEHEEYGIWPISNIPTMIPTSPQQKAKGEKRKARGEQNQGNKT